MWLVVICKLGVVAEKKWCVFYGLIILLSIIFITSSYLIDSCRSVTQQTMAHKQYANLAHLDEFPFDLDYTGVLLKGWMSPVCLFPVVYGAFSIMTAGWPKSWIAVWALFNFAVIHPMDL